MHHPKPEPIEIPPLGIGTWQNTDPRQCAKSVKTALEMGYRHVDTAQIYGNERAVGEGISLADVPREDIFLATKVWTSNLDPDAVVDTTHGSLEKLDTEYVDLLYVHWPAGEYDPERTLPAFERLRDDGLIRHIGVSNFEPEHVEAAQAAIDAPIVANQIEIHPYLPQHGLLDYLHSNDIAAVGYSPLARTAVLDDERLQAIAKRYEATPAQVTLAWLRQLGVIPIPKATSESHIRENWESRQLALEDEDLTRIDEIPRRERQVHPEFGPDSWDN